MNRKMVLFSRQDSAESRATAMEESLVKHCAIEQCDLLVIPSLYHLAESSKLWTRIAEETSRYDRVFLLCTLHPRPAHWLLHRHGIAVEESQILNLNAFKDADSVLNALAKLLGEKSRNEQSDRQEDNRSEEDGADRQTPTILRAQVRQRWYPVVDGSRCIQCQHCLQFCLFGVYVLDTEGKVRVQNPDLCKPGCPACSRICPQSAIMFPLYEKDEAIAGSPGKLVAMDPAARKMFYQRTQQPCPVCGRKVTRKSSSTAGDRLCPECGCPLPKASQADGKSSKADEKKAASSDPTKTTARAAFDDLDSLVDQLEQTMRRKG